MLVSGTPPIGTVVATLGTTAAGAVDPLADILELRQRHPFRLHVDTAYGGYFTLADNLAPEARAHYDRISEADSIVIDPHKHGLQPYGCGCVLFRDPTVGRFYRLAGIGQGRAASRTVIPVAQDRDPSRWG